MNAFRTKEGKAAVLNYYDLFLKKLTVPYEELTVNTSFGKTFVIAAGKIENPPIVLVHGSGINATMWIGDIEKLSKNYRVYAPDLLGEAGKSDENRFPFDTSDYSDWLLEVFDILRIDNAVLVGASHGGWLTIKFSINHTDRVNKLVLLCPAGVSAQNERFRSIALTSLMKGEKGLDELIDRMNGNNSITKSMHNYQKLIFISFNLRPEVVPIFTDDELKRLTMPIILFVGDSDIMFRTYELVKRFERVLPHAECVVLKGRGHSLTEISDRIKDFLKDTSQELLANRY